MRYSAKMTTKGQVTVPVEVREALGLETGDFLAFEVKEDYIVVKRRPTLEEVLEKHKDILPKGPPRFVTKDEALADYFRDLPPDDLSDTLILAQSRGFRKGAGS
jgi:AbrB family looped-hinge helix DNA binding protein